MKKAVIEIDSNQLLNALEQLPSNELKKMIDTLFLKRLFKKPGFEEVSAKARKTIKEQGLRTEVVEEAIEWARKQK
jgi:pantoate kinase